MKNYRVGEKKDCAVTVSNILDSTDFNITAATYLFHSGSTVYATGACSVSGKTVFATLQPSVTSTTAAATFTITCQPLINGLPDTSKTTEIVMFDVQITVTK